MEVITKTTVIKFDESKDQEVRYLKIAAGIIMELCNSAIREQEVPGVFVRNGIDSIHLSDTDKLGATMSYLYDVL